MMDPKQTFDDALLRLAEPALAAPEIARLVETALQSLAKLKIGPEGSRLSYLHGDLHLALSRIRARDGRQWPAIWEAMLAHSIGKGDSPDAGALPLATARTALRRGNATIALEAQSVAQTLALTPSQRDEARLLQLLALRLSGRVDEAAAAESTLRLSLAKESPILLPLAWEAFCREAQKTQGLNRMVNAVARGGTHRSAQHMLEASLWAKAVASKQFIPRVPKADSIRKLFPEDVRKPSPNAVLYDCALGFDRLYDAEIPLHQRLEDLGELLERVPRLGELSHELLVWAVAVRWLVRHHQNLMAEQALAEYRALSLRLTDGTLDDCLTLVSDLDVKAWSRFEDSARAAVDAERRTFDRIKTSRLSRAAALTKLAVAAGGTRLIGKLKGLGADAETKQKIAEEWREDVILRFVEVLSRLKGPMVKFGQMLGLMVPSLPPPVQTALASLRDSTEPLPSAVIRERVAEALGAPIDQLFAAWDDTPLAAASIGQLHRARLKDGREVVVKVQYPGIRAAIDSDMSILRTLAPVARGYFPNANIDDALALSHRHFHAECDYRLEAQHQTFARSINLDDPAVVVPEVVDSHTCDTVLTMDYVAGAGYSEFVANATAEEMRSAAKIIYVFAWRSFLKHGFVNGDPHPGNFLFLADGRVAFLDFGFASRYAPERVPIIKNILRSVMTDDFPLFERTLTQVGLAVEGQPFDVRATWETTLRMMVAIRTKGAFRFVRRNVMENFENATIKSSNRGAMRLPLEDAMLLRLSWCLQAVLGDLGAEADWSQIMGAFVFDDYDARRMTS